jgi:hypothetical protein
MNNEQTPAASASRHTPEPNILLTGAWMNNFRCIQSDYEQGNKAGARARAVAFENEMLAAHNALAGMNPEKVKDALLLLEEGTNALRWIAQEAEQRGGVPKPIIGGARHHADKITAALTALKS